ncbi:MAG: hypothetical protein ACK5KO_00495 [Arachnia sp.]
MSATLFITIGVMTIIAALTVGLWARSRSVRTLIAGFGLMLLPLGLYLTQMTGLLINGIGSLIDWAQRTVWDDAMTWGVGSLAVGVVFLVVAGFLPKPKPAPRPKQPPPRKAAGSGAKPQVSATGAPTVAAPPAGASSDPEDDEIEAILRKRGIM